MKKQTGLGRGLSALLEDPNLEFTQQKGGISSVPLHKVEPNPLQPRREFDPEALQALADSITAHGMIQPLTVRELPGGYYQIIAGERRWRCKDGRTARDSCFGRGGRRPQGHGAGSGREPAA